MQTRSRARAAAQDLSGGEPAEGKVGSDIVTAVNSDTYAQRNSDGVSTVADASTTRQTRTKRPAANEARKLGNPKRRSKRQRVVAGDRPQDEATVCNTGLFSKLPTEARMGA